MKKEKLFGFILVSVILLLTGCETSHELECVKEDDNEKVSLKFEYNKEDSEIQKVSMTSDYTIPKGTSSQQINSYKETKEKVCEKKTFDSCEVSVVDNILSIKIKGNPDSVGYKSKRSIDDLKKQLEEEKYSCK